MAETKKTRAAPKTTKAKAAARKKTEKIVVDPIVQDTHAEPKSKVGPKEKSADILEKLDEITEWSAEGLTHEQIAASLGMSSSTFYKHKADYPEISEALSKGRILFRQNIVPKVEEAAWKLALGYEVLEGKTIKDSKGSTIRTEVSKKHVSPNATMLIFMLQNLAGTVYKDRRNFELTGAEGKDLPAAQVIILPDNGRDRSDNKT